MSFRRYFCKACSFILLAGLLCVPVLAGCSSGESVPAALMESSDETEPTESILESLPSEPEPQAEEQSSTPETEPPQDGEGLGSSPEENKELPSNRTLKVETIFQTPELPTGCEITALTMALQYHGYEVSKTTMAKQYLPKSSKWYYVGDKRYGPDTRVVFAGNPFSSGGAVCGASAIVTAADRYLSDTGAGQRAVNLTGSSPEELYDMVRSGTPVVVWVTIEMVDRSVSGGWYVEGTDEYLEWSKMDHCAVLMGVQDDRVVINDPITGVVTYSKERFESVYKQRGLQAVIIR